MATITAKDGHVTRLTTAANTGENTLLYNGNVYLCRLLSQNIDQIQAMSSSGYDVVPSFGLTIADPDSVLWVEEIAPHGWRGATMIVTFLMWDVISNSYSTDSYNWKFLLGKPSWANGVITVDSTSKMNMGRIKVPSVRIGRTCPWVFPETNDQRNLALNDPTSIFYQCPYSPDFAFGLGNMNPATGQPFTSCDYTRQSCEARGMFSRDSHGKKTGSFGGITWIPPVQYSGKQYTTGQKTYGFNQPNVSIFGQYFSLVYGRQWVDCTVISPAADPNSLRTEAVVCVALFGPATVIEVHVNNVIIPYNNSDKLMTWRYVNQGGRIGTINGDAIFDSKGDPYGSLCCIEVVVPVQLASAGSVPTVRALVDGPPVTSFVPNGSGGFNALYAQTVNPVWHLLDLLMWGNWRYDLTSYSSGDIDPNSFYSTALLAAQQISYLNLTGATVSHERFRSSFALHGSQSQTLSAVVTALRNCANLSLAPNSLNGLLQCNMRMTLADEQPALIPGSNLTNAWPSEHADTSAGTGYYAYLFNETNIIKGSFNIVSRPIADIPNRVYFSFQDEDNAWQDDSLSQVDADAYISSGNTPIDVPLQVIGIPNFDQGTRIANVQMSESLRGNERDDADGTIYFEFKTTVKAIHLIPLMGAICLLTWQQIEYSEVPIRLLSAQPATDGETIIIRAAWHNDDWYTDLYGQNPAPFYRNPYLAPDNRPPYPWRAGMPNWLATDALFPGVQGFGVIVDNNASPVALQIYGVLPQNSTPSGDAPLVPLQAQSSNSGGIIAPGSYFVTVVGRGGPTPRFVSAIVPTGTLTNTITVTGIVWLAAQTGVTVYIGKDAMSMRAVPAGNLIPSNLDQFNNPTTFTITAYPPDGLGLPDQHFNSLVMRAKYLIHGGVWGDIISSAVPLSRTGNGTATFADAAWTTDQWVGYILSVYQPIAAGGASIYDPGNAQTLDFLITGNNNKTLTFSGQGPIAGLVCVCRAKTTVYSANRIGDPQFVNSFAPSGLIPNQDTGSLLRIIAGTGVGDPPYTVVGNDAFSHTIDGQWLTTPDATSVYIIEEPAWRWTFTTGNLTNTGNSTPLKVGDLPLLNFVVSNSVGSVLVQVLAADQAGNLSLEKYAPLREIYVPATQVSNTAISITRHR